MASYITFLLPLFHPYLACSLNCTTKLYIDCELWIGINVQETARDLS